MSDDSELMRAAREARYLLLQVREPDDPIRTHEVECFEHALGCPREAIDVFDLLSGAPPAARIDAADVVLLGGSGDHSVARGGPWLEAALDAMRGLHGDRKPTFASCWGFQAMARALGGEVVTDHGRAEVGAVPLRLTEAGHADPVFAPLGERFFGQSGHEDVVVSLPADAILLASSERVRNQAFRFRDRPIYCTQFHPELAAADLVRRIARYPVYLPLCGVASIEELRAVTPETRETTALLPRFVAHVLGERGA